MVLIGGIVEREGVEERQWRSSMVRRGRSIDVF
jgi:hypothetical protein